MVEPTVRLPLDEAFRRQWERFALRFCCEDCAYWDGRQDRCAHGWPTRDHRLPHYRGGEATEVVYCKEFELA